MQRNALEGNYHWEKIKRKNGAPGRSRTSDHLVRSQVLYPAELRAHCIEVADYVRKHV